jgi:peptide/nickel transport system permease protein
MPASTLASATAEAEAPEAPPPSRARWRLARRRFLRHPAGVVGLALTAVVVGAAAFADRIASTSPFRSVARPLRPPSASHLMGTDNLGRDLFSAVVHGARTSMLVMAAVITLASVIGIAVGTAAGYRGGWVDDVLMRVTELFQSVPRFFLALLVIALFGPGVDHLIFVLGLTSWPILARVVRAEVLSVRDRDYVEAARSLGARDGRIVLRHVLPNVLPPAVVVITLTGSTVILLEASLAFIGLSDPNVMSWGYLVSNAQPFIRIAWWMSVFPGVAIAMAVLGINLMSDGLNDVLNTQARPARSWRSRLTPRWRRRRPSLAAEGAAPAMPPAAVVGAHDAAARTGG